MSSHLSRRVARTLGEAMAIVRRLKGSLRRGVVALVGTAWLINYGVWDGRGGPERDV